MKTIIVTTDFSASANNAVYFAAELAKLTQARLHILTVYHVPVVVAEVPAMPDMKGIEEEAYNKLQTLAEDMQEKFGIASIIKAEMGFTVDELNNYTEKVNADLIVMGMHGRSKMSEVLLGSTTVSYIAKTSTPVLIIPEEAKFRKPEWIALSTDLKELELHTLDPLKALLHLFKSKLYLVNVTEGDGLPDYEKSVAGIALDHYLEEFAHIYYFPENKSVVDGMDAFIEAHKVDWLTMIPHKHNLLDKLFNKSQTRKMAYHTTLPLLILPERSYPEIKE